MSKTIWLLNSMKRIIGLLKSTNRTTWLLAGVVILLLMSSSGTHNWKDYVYNWEEIILEEAENEERASRSVVNNGKGLYYMLTSEENTSYRIVNVGMDGSGISSIEIKRDWENIIHQWDVDHLGNIYIVVSKQIPAGCLLPKNSEYYLVKMDSKGTELWRRSLTEKGKEYTFGITAMKALTDGNIAVAGNEGIVRYNSKGELKGHIESPGTGAIWQIIQLKDGNIVVHYSKESMEVVFGKLDFSGGRLYEEYIFPCEGRYYGAGGYKYMFYPGAEYDLLFSDSVGVKGYNLGDKHVTEIMNLLDSDSDMFSAPIIQKKKRELYMIRTDEGKLKIIKFKKAYLSGNKRRQIVTLGCFGKSEMIHKEVLRFNRTNDKYRIRIKDYLYSPGTYEERDGAGRVKWKEDMTSGNPPDIMFYDQLPVESYGSKKLFEDLYAYIDKDEELKRSDFFINILKAYENDGKLPLLVPGFVIHAVVGKTANIGKETGWSLDELKKVMESKCRVAYLLGMHRSNILKYGISISGEDYINWKTGECKFNSAAFIEFLEFLEKLPEHYFSSTHEPYLQSIGKTPWGEDIILLEDARLTDASGGYWKTTFKDPITFKGFPSESKRGPAIEYDTVFAMPKRANNKDGAWEFMRYFLTDEYQNILGYYEWPLSIKRAEKLNERAKSQYEGLTYEEIDEVFKFINTADQLYLDDRYILNTILKEADDYFGGVKSAEEAAEAIQSKVQKYVEERGVEAMMSVKERYLMKEED